MLTWLRSLFCSILDWQMSVLNCECCPSGTVHWSMTFGNLTISGEGFRMATKIPVDFAGEIVLRVKYVDSKGNAAQVDGFPTWQSSDENVFKVQADTDDPFMAKGTLVGGLGMCQVSATADADMGEGTKPVTLLGDIEVLAGEAVGGVIEVTLTPAA